MSAPDAGRLAAIHAEAFDAPWDASALQALLDSPGVFVVQEVEGFILCRVVADEAEVLTLAVRPAARRGGLGTRLTDLAAGRAAAMGATRLFLEVAEDNAAARTLYERTGFRAIGRRKGYYARTEGHRVDALLLALNFSAELPSG